MCPARIFIIDGGDLLSKEGPIQGYPSPTSAYAFGILPLLQLSLISFPSTNSAPRALLLQMTLKLLANYQALPPR